MANSVVNYDFENPFGSAMNPLSGGSGVLEQIQEQVSNNGDVLRSMQGGIGGIDGSPFVGATQNPGIDDMFGVPQPIMERPGPTVPEGIFDNPINASTGGSGEMPDFSSMMAQSEAERYPNLDQGFFSSQQFKDLYPTGPSSTIATQSKYFGQGNSNVTQKDNAYESYLKATGQDDKLINLVQGNASAVGDGIFGADGVQGTINVTAPIQGNGSIDPDLRHPSFYAQPGSPMSFARAQLFKEGGVAGLMMKKTEIMEMPADRSKLVLDRIMKKAGAAPSNDPRLMAQLAQVLGRDG